MPKAPLTNIRNFGFTHTLFGNNVWVDPKFLPSSFFCRDPSTISGMRISRGSDAIAWACRRCRRASSSWSPADSSQQLWRRHGRTCRCAPQRGNEGPHDGSNAWVADYSVEKPFCKGHSYNNKARPRRKNDNTSNEPKTIGMYIFAVPTNQHSDSQRPNYLLE